MNNLSSSVTGIEIKNFKCFGEIQTINDIRPVNVIIGKNNAGKSAVIDTIQYLVSPHSINQKGHKGSKPEIYLKAKITENDISRSFSGSTSGGGVPGRSFYEYGLGWLNREMRVKIPESGNNEFFGIEDEVLPDFWNQQKFGVNLANNFVNPFSGKTLRRVSAERNISPEQRRDLDVNPDGFGATNIIQRFINDVELDKTVVENDLLKQLNDIFSPDTLFTEISTQINGEGFWEIYLHEKNKGAVSLNNSGSGLKTVILVLINTILIPKLLNKQPSQIIFCFEELENNLHPALQRNLFSYLEKYSVSNKTTIFTTTHSNVVIDIFSNSENSQIFYVENDGNQSSIKAVRTYIDNTAILDSLDFRASDLLQSNGVIWIEGPSDRIYINHFISLWTEKNLREGLHYRCIFYGGRLLSHLSASHTQAESSVYILDINRNAVILIDSDRDSVRKKLNDTKLRLVEEISKINGLSWVTKGREIENYIPQTSLKKFISTRAGIDVANIRDIEQFEKMENYLNEIHPNLGDWYKDNKPVFASQIIDFISKDDLESHLDLKDRLNALTEYIRSWNKILAKQ